MALSSMPGRIETDAAAHARPGNLQRIYHPTKLAAIVDALVAEGVALDDALGDVAVPPEALHAPTSLVSLQQVLTACRNAVRLSRDPSLAFRTGISMHVSAYGMYGYAILCGADFRRTMAFCEKYHALATPLVAMAFREASGIASWDVDPIIRAHPDDPLYRFIVEMQMGVTLSLVRDVMGSDFRPREIALTYARPIDPFPLETLAGCGATFGQPANRFVFDAAWLDASPTLGNVTTYAFVVSLCDDLLGSLSARAGIAGRIRASLLNDIARHPTLPTTARQLGTTERTLRRQLAQEGTSFRELIDELRAQVAIRYLRETTMTNDDIAGALGFSDAANFRHAFRRWTDRSPSDFRPAPRRLS